MKLAFLVNDINSNGGVERVVITLANKLSKEYKYKVKIISLRQSDNKCIYNINKDVEITFLNYKEKGKNSFQLCFNEFNFIRKKIKNKVMIIISKILT